MISKMVPWNNHKITIKPRAGLPQYWLFLRSLKAGKYIFLSILFSIVMTFLIYICKYIISALLNFQGAHVMLFVYASCCFVIFFTAAQSKKNSSYNPIMDSMTLHNYD